MIEFKDLKKALIELGVDSNLVEMPAIIERVTKILYDCRDVDEIKEQLSVNGNGIITLDENPSKKEKRIIVFGKTENGASIKIHMEYDPDDEFSIRITVDENGMDSKVIVYDALTGNSHVQIKRENGIIMYEAYNISTGGNVKRYKDNGDACLAYSLESRIIRRSYGQNKEYFSNRYPITEKFYKRLDARRKNKGILDDTEQK